MRRRIDLEKATRCTALIHVYIHSQEAKVAKLNKVATIAYSTAKINVLIHVLEEELTIYTDGTTHLDIKKTLSLMGNCKGDYN